MKDFLSKQRTVMDNFSILGPPGSGKTTQAKYIADKHGLTWMSPGAIFRAVTATNTEIGIQIGKYLSEGELVPPALLVQILDIWFEQNPTGKGYVFDGYPRKKEDVDHMDTILEKLETNITKVFYLHVSEDVIMSRLNKRAYLENRGDESLSVVRTRIAEYHEETEAVLYEFKLRGKLIEIDGNRSVAEVSAFLDKSIKTLLNG